MGGRNPVRKDTLCRAVLSAPGKRKCQGEEVCSYHWQRSGESGVMNYEYKYNIRTPTYCYPRDDLMAFHTQHYILDREFDFLVNVPDTPPDTTTSGPLPPALPQNSLLDGLVAIRNAPSVLSGPLPPIQSLDDREVKREIYEPSPLRPWRLVQSHLGSHLVDTECVTTEQLEDRVSYLNDDGTIPVDFYWDDEWDQSDTQTTQEESPNYDASACFSVFPYYRPAAPVPPEEPNHVPQLGRVSPVPQPNGFRPTGGPPGYDPMLTSPIWPPQSPAVPWPVITQQYMGTSYAPEDAEFWTVGDSPTMLDPYGLTEDEEIQN